MYQLNDSGIRRTSLENTKNHIGQIQHSESTEKKWLVISGAARQGERAREKVGQPTLEQQVPMKCRMFHINLP